MVYYEQHLGFLLVLLSMFSSFYYLFVLFIDISYLKIFYSNTFLRL